MQLKPVGTLNPPLETPIPTPNLLHFEFLAWNLFSASSSLESFDQLLTSYVFELWFSMFFLTCFLFCAYDFKRLIMSLCTLVLLNFIFGNIKTA